MRLSHSLFFTTKQVPAEAELISHKLMLKAGLIKPIASGLYSFLPIGYRVLDKIISIVKEEMDRSGAQQLLLPFVQPAQLWRESGRWEEYGDELLRFQDRKGSWFVLSPTHEEIITKLAGEILNSYKKLPVVVYQIQIKFRDELRPRGGVIRAREFLMKDAYSFCQSDVQMREVYQKMQAAYERIFSRCGLKYKLVEAESGPIGGDLSHEFIAEVASGEDKIAECGKCGYSAKMEKAIAGRHKEKKSGEKMQKLEEVKTPNVRSIEDLSNFLGFPPSRLLKTLLYQTEKNLLAVVVRGDHQVNEEKLRKLLGIRKLTLASDELVKKEIGVETGFLGPVDLNNLELVVDEVVMQGRNFVAGANKKDTHLVNVNPGRDFSPNLIGDIRFILPGEECPICGASLYISRGIEIGHLFQLGQRYSRALGASFLDQKGKLVPFLMGCYGIGISRLPAAIIEQNNDREGIIWPPEIAPFSAVIISTNEQVTDFSEKIYQQLKQASIDILWDDRDVSAGVKFKDADLMGIPLKIIIGSSFLKEEKIEIKKRQTGEIIKIDKNQLFPKLRELI